MKNKYIEKKNEDGRFKKRRGSNRRTKGGRKKDKREKEGEARTMGPPHP